MNETSIQILNATIDAVSQYGMRRTSMNDIAGRADVSRQTVYNLFKNKDEIYRAAILHMGAMWQEKAKRRLLQAKGFPEKLDVLFGIYAIDAFKFSHGRKDSEDMFEEAHFAAPEALAEFFAGARRLYAEILQPYNETLQAKGTSAEEFSDQIEIACRGYKRDARSLAHLKKLLATQKLLILSLIDR